MAGTRSRGQPLVVLAVLLTGWVGARALAWNLLPDEPDIVAVAGLDQQALTPPPIRALSVGAAGTTRNRVAAVHASVQPAPPLAPAPGALPPMWQDQPLRPVPPPRADFALIPLAEAPVVRPGVEQRMATAGGHQLLWLAAAAMLPLPADVAARVDGARAPVTSIAPLPRWSADGWLFLRRGGSVATFPRLSGGGTYGASQAGAVLRYRIAPADPHRPALYLRGAGALNGTREQEVALGLAARPLAGVPVAAMAELRATRNAQGLSARPALALVTELPPQRLPLGFTGEAYVQGGYVGGRFATAFIDGLARAERNFATVEGAEVHAGGGIWGARQRGAARLDVGPVASVRLRLGDTASARLEADWRFRVAGGASPGSGPALTLSAGF
ncbi:MAG TPA: hypothetical protein VFP14_06865 [Novosphingobium sp.]|nr:hypothetical protein [Novosphingobium sp.]